MSRKGKFIERMEKNNSPFTLTFLSDFFSEEAVVGYGKSERLKEKMRYFFITFIQLTEQGIFIK